MSRDKYRSIFSGQMEAMVLIILQIFFTKCANLKIREYYSDIPQFLLGIQSPDAFTSINTQWIIINNYSPFGFDRISDHKTRKKSV